MAAASTRPPAMVECRVATTVHKGRKMTEDSGQSVDAAQAGHAAFGHFRASSADAKQTTIN